MAERGDPTVAAEQWEHGSSPHLTLATGTPDYPWADVPATLWGSGRDALRALLAWGRSSEGWARLLVPSFFCQEVTAALVREIPVAVYPHAPTTGARAEVATRSGDVVLVVATFGLRQEPAIAGPAVVVEDHTHDPLSPWAAASAADYAAASLRKTLPLPDGGVLWSPRGHALPAERPMSGQHARATLAHLSAMTLKRLYLSGAAVSKDAFRAEAAAGEPLVGTGPISGISPYSRERLGSLPADSWRARRIANLAAFRSAFGEPPGVTLLDAPFAAILVFDDAAERDRARRALAERRVYAAVHWPLDAPVVAGIPAEDVDLARRILTLHADWRYTADEMATVAGHLLEVLAQR